MTEARRPDMAALWKNFALADDPESPAVQAPAVAINAVNGPMVSIVTSHPVDVGALWAQACESHRHPPSGKR